MDEWGYEQVNGCYGGIYPTKRYLPFRCPRCTRKLAEEAKPRETFGGKRMCSSCFHHATLTALSDHQMAAQAEHVKGAKK